MLISLNFSFSSLLLNAVIFYLPELLRLACGGEHLMRRVKNDIFFGKPDSTDRFATLADYLTRNRVQFRSYILKSSLCELLCIPIWLAQVWVSEKYSSGYQIVNSPIFEF